MRFLHLADLHIGSKLQTGDAELCAQAKEKMWLYLEQLFSNLDSEQIDLCLLAGDVFEPSTLSASELERFIACLKLPKRCYILAVAGNHDPLTASFPWQTVLKQKLTNFHLFNKAVESIYFANLQTVVSGFSFASLYQDEGVLPEIKHSTSFYCVRNGDSLAEMAPWQPSETELSNLSANCLKLSLVHASPVHPAFSVREDDYHYNPLRVEQIEAANVDYLALGHFHKPIVSRYTPDDYTTLDREMALMREEKQVFGYKMYELNYDFTDKGDLELSKSSHANSDRQLDIPTLNGTLMMWPGNLIGRNFGESGYRGCFVGNLGVEKMAQSKGQTAAQTDAQTETSRAAQAPGAEIEEAQILAQIKVPVTAQEEAEMSAKMQAQEATIVVEQGEAQDLAQTSTQTKSLELAANLEAASKGHLQLAWYSNGLRQFWQLEYDLTNLRKQISGATVTTDKLAKLILGNLQTFKDYKQNLYRLTLQGELGTEESLDIQTLAAKLQLACPQLELKAQITKAIDWDELAKTDSLAALLLDVAKHEPKFSASSVEDQHASLKLAWQALQTD